MNLKQLAEFCRRMGIGLKAGVDLLRLLDNEQKMGSSVHRQTMAAVSSSVRGGATLAEAMRERGSYFPNMLIQMTDASEVGGRMEGTFAFMARYYDQLRKTRSEFIQKITWPVIQLALAILIVGLVILLQGLLSPQSEFDASGLGLRGVRGFFLYLLVVLSVLSALAVIAYGLWKNWLGCHRWLTPIIQRIPQLGTALVTLSMSRLSVTLSMLLNAGVDAKHAVKQAFLATGNHYFMGGMDQAISQIDRGSSFADAFESSAVLPQEFVDAVRIGELSGTETESLDHLAEEYQQRSANALSTIATIASMTIWIGTMVLIGALVILMAMQYLGLLYSTINNPMGKP